MPVESNPLKLTEIDRHEIANPKEVLVKIEACGVCHSQLHSIEGDWEDIGIPPTLPTVPGHEIVGKIILIKQLVDTWTMDALIKNEITDEERLDQLLALIVLKK